MIQVLYLMGVLSAASFANNVITASNRNAKFDWKRSRCFCSAEVLGFRYLIPLFSYIGLKGKCNVCSKHIPVRYFLVELIVAAIGTIMLYTQAISAESIATFLVMYGLIIIIFTDYLYYIIPNTILIFLLIISSFRLHMFPDAIAYRALATVIVIIALSLVNYYYQKKRKKQAVGYGDIKLLGLLYFLYRPETASIGLWISAIIALIAFPLMKKLNSRYNNEKRIPFGVFLSTTFLLVELFRLDRTIEQYFTIYVLQ